VKIHNLQRTLTCCVVLALVVATAKTSLADVTLTTTENGWEVFTNGRVGVFLSYVAGDGFPQPTYGMNNVIVHDIRGGGMDNARTEREAIMPGSQIVTQGTVDGMRIRSGFVPNIFGIGVKRKLTETTTFKAYMALWAYIESDDRRKYYPIWPDMREGYIKFEGPWGSVLAGRSLTLFSRGATEIAFMYGHGYGLGYPGNVDNHGPTAGHIGFGVLANGFGAGLVYATPMVAGFQLSAAVYDPSSLVGAWERTKWVRPEAELTYDLAFGDLGRVHLFANGGWQKIYKDSGPEDETVYGAGYGGRVEVGPVRLGLAGHYGKGLGLNYALDSSYATYDERGQLRIFDGYYAQAQVALGNFDLSAGLGVTRVHLLPTDTIDNRDDDNDPNTPATNDDANPGAADSPAHSIIKQQMGISAGVVYHLTDSLHLDLDYFRANFSWWLGEKQAVNFVSAGVTTTW
jgi:hypothetical protein